MEQPQRSPELWSLSSEPEERDDSEYRRVCTDLAMLMRVEELKVALRYLGLPVGGLKPDQAARLGAYMASNMSSSQSPTRRQCTYLLGLWRARDLQGRILLRYDDIRNRIEAKDKAAA